MNLLCLAEIEKVLQRALEKNIKFNKEKMKLAQTSIPSFGHIITDEGIKPNPERVAAIKEMKPPTDITTLQSFLAMAYYTGRFLPNLSSMTAPLRDLVKKEDISEWQPHAQKAFEKIKEEIAKAATLCYTHQEED
jgi:hypothetical protein